MAGRRGRADSGALAWRDDGSLAAGRAGASAAETLKPPILVPVAAAEARLRELVAEAAASLLVRRHAASVASHFKNAKAAAAAEAGILDVTASTKALMAAVSLLNDTTARMRVATDRALSEAREARAGVIADLRRNSEEMGESTDRTRTGKLIAGREGLHRRLAEADALVRSLATRSVAFIEDPDGLITALLNPQAQQPPQPPQPPPPPPPVDGPQTGGAPPVVGFHDRTPQLVWVDA
jgi:hypothetical protein